MAHSSKKQFNLRLPIDLIDALKAAADAKGITVTDLAIDLLKQGILLSDQTFSTSPKQPSPAVSATSGRSIEQPTIEQLALAINTLTQRIEQLEAQQLPNAVKTTSPELARSPQLPKAMSNSSSEPLLNRADFHADAIASNNDSDIIPWL